MWLERKIALEGEKVREEIVSGREKEKQVKRASREVFILQQCKQVLDTNTLTYTKTEIISFNIIDSNQ